MNQKLRAASAIRNIVPILILIIQIHGTEPQMRHGEKSAIIPFIRLQENRDYTLDSGCIIMIRLSELPDATMRYFLEGIGASEEPRDLFTVNPVDGCVKVNRLLDREEIPSYFLKGVGKFPDGTRAVEDLDFTVTVEDMNDNQPVFSLTTGAVNESSAADTYVMTITANDADEGIFAEITYDIVEQSPSQGASFFSINKETGQIFVKLNTLDRETQDTYTLTVKATDCKGCSTGHSVTAKFVVKILDINDNIPKLEKSYYEVKVMENAFNVMALRFKALDADLIHTDNWLAVFTIVSGNEAGYFSITTDPETNEGILVLNKAIDYEELKELSLEISVSNKAEYHSSVVVKNNNIYPFKIHVQNEREGNHFQPVVKVVRVSEEHTSINLKEVIATYQATDTDTMQRATNVTYLKREDEDNWITIDQKTAEIRLNKFPDRESKYLVNGTYYAKIICVSQGREAAFRTATGTIAIQVEDKNDNYPTLTSTYQTMCYGDNAVYVTAVDRDAFPNGAPFEFKVSSNTKEQWTVERLNDTGVILRSKEFLWPGFYKVFLEIQDLQGKKHADKQVLDIEVCSCTNSKTPLPRDPRARLGPAVILLLLCLLPLPLLFFWCENTRTFKPMPLPPKQHIVVHNTEGQGEDTKVPMVLIPTQVNTDFIQISQQDAKGQEMSLLVAPTEVDGGFSKTSHGSGVAQPCTTLTVSEAFLHEYYSQKARCIDQCPDEAHPLVYSCEGRQSPVGSLGCCSLLQDDQELDFLNDLEPKFKTLANICSSKASEVESSKVMVTAPPPPSAPHVGNVAISAEISQSISASKAEANSLAALSARIQESIDSATHLATSTAQLQENIVIPPQTVVIQQPSVHYTAATPPVYVMDPKPNPILLVGPAANLSKNLVMVERMATTGSAQLQGIGQGVLGVVENLHGAQGLVVLRGGASTVGDPQQLIRGQSASFNVPFETVQESTHRVLVQKMV